MGAHGSLLSQALYTVVAAVIESEPWCARAGWAKNTEELARGTPTAMDNVAIEKY